MVFAPGLFGFLDFLSTTFVIKAFFILFLVFYSVFALIIFRQIQLMAKSLPMSLSPLLKFVAIVHIGVAVALLFVVLGVFKNNGS